MPSATVLKKPKPVARLATKPARIRAPEGQLFKLKLGGAYQAREDGFIHVDRIASDNVDHVVDLKSFPWPIDSAVVDFIFCAYYFQRLTREERHAFMNECCRILKPGAQLVVQVPHWSSMRAITDPLAPWPPLCESSFMVYSRQWREQEKMTDLPLTCDFGGSYGYGTTVDGDIAVRNDEFQQQARKHWLNANLDLNVTLTKA